jgi:hypothetical protein
MMINIGDRLEVAQSGKKSLSTIVWDGLDMSNENIQRCQYGVGS